MSRVLPRIVPAFLISLWCVPAIASDQQPPTSAASTADPTTAVAASSQTPDDDPDRDPNLAQPDFNLASLPTSARLPRNGSAFRITHRFTRPLGDGDFSGLVEDLFGLDSGAQIGLEYRFGLFRGGQVGVHRTSNRTIQLFALYDVWSQRYGAPIGITALGSIDGTNNFRDSYSAGLGVVLSRELDDRAAVYVEPIWVNNTNAQPSELTAEDNSSVMLGLGIRARIRPTVYVFAEASPRVAGYDPGATQISFGVEKRAGGHLFQLNLSNGFGTTLAQIARGAASYDDWYLGFNISRKFY